MGWVALAAIVCISAYVWYNFRKAKNTKTPKKYWRIPIQGFADVFVSKSYFVGELEVEYTKDMADELGDAMYRTMQDLWEKCEDVYENSPEHGWCVDKIVVMKDGMPEDHKHVVWTAPHGNIRLLLQDTLHYWFARECHNVFRYRIYGMGWIYNTRGPEDIAHTLAVEMWINDTYIPTKETYGE